LIETMTVLVILGIAASMVVPSFASYIDRTRTSGALNQVVADISYARIYAVQQGRRTALQLTSDGSYTIDTMSTGGAWAPIRTVRRRDNYSGVSWKGATTSLEFNSRGVLMNFSSNGYIRLERGTTRDSVFVSPAGRTYRAY
jgi:Tfp pilus assembly protein FimT